MEDESKGNAVPFIYTPNWGDWSVCDIDLPNTTGGLNIEVDTGLWNTNQASIKLDASKHALEILAYLQEDPEGTISKGYEGPFIEIRGGTPSFARIHGGGASNHYYRSLMRNVSVACFAAGIDAVFEDPVHTAKRYGTSNGEIVSHRDRKIPVPVGKDSFETFYFSLDNRCEDPELGTTTIKDLFNGRLHPDVGLERLTIGLSVVSRMGIHQRRY